MDAALYASEGPLPPQTRLDRTLHQLILLQLERACEDPSSVVPTQTAAQTIRAAIAIIRNVEDLAFVSNFKLHEDRDVLTISWHRYNHVVVLEVAQQAPYMRDCYVVSYQADDTATKARTKISSRQHFTHLALIELRYLLTHWSA